MKSKLWILVTILIVTSMALAACQPMTVVETVVIEKEKQIVTSVEVQKEVEKVVEVTPTPLPKGKVKITILVGFGTGTQPKQQVVHQQLQDRYNSTHKNIQIEFLTVPGT